MPKANKCAISIGCFGYFGETETTVVCGSMEIYWFQGFQEIWTRPTCVVWRIILESNEKKNKSIGLRFESTGQIVSLLSTDFTVVSLLSTDFTVVSLWSTDFTVVCLWSTDFTVVCLLSTDFETCSLQEMNMVTNTTRAKGLKPNVDGIFVQHEEKNEIYNQTVKYLFVSILINVGWIEEGICYVKECMP